MIDQNQTEVMSDERPSQILLCTADEGLDLLSVWPRLISCGGFLNVF